GLDEGADGVLRRRIHLREELREAAGRVTPVDPRLVIGEVEVGGADEKVARAVTVERPQPTRRRFEVARESVDVGRAGRDDAPAEDGDASRLGHGSVWDGRRG